MKVHIEKDGKSPRFMPNTEIVSELMKGSHFREDSRRGFYKEKYSYYSVLRDSKEKALVTLQKNFSAKNNEERVRKALSQYRQPFVPCLRARIAL